MVRSDDEPASCRKPRADRVGPGSLFADSAFHGQPPSRRPPNSRARSRTISISEVTMETPTTANSAIASRLDSTVSFLSMVHRAHCAVVQLRQRTARCRSCGCDGDRPVKGCIRVACPPSFMNAPNRGITGHPTKEATQIARGGFIAWPRACAAGCRIQQQEQATCESCRTLACRSDASTVFTRSAAEVVMLIPTTPIRANAFQSNVMCASIYPSGRVPRTASISGS